jgi:signal peptidase I
MNRYFIHAEPDPDPDGMGQGAGKFKRFLLEFGQTLLISLVMYFAINALSARIRVQSISMQPTLYERDFVLVNKIAYKFDAPHRGDVIIFRPPPDPQGEPYIKRIIGLPGDTVEIKNRQVFINGTPLREHYIMAEPYYQGKWTVLEGMLFVLGDNRNNSSDSHQWGMVPIENVIGKAEFVYFPITHWQMLNPTTAEAAVP